jgi:anti-sigma regulatory factor (Ser/Thr protein kinase)
LPELIVEANAPGTRLASIWLADSASELGVPSSDVDRLDVCLNEVMANIISHGASDSPLLRIHLFLQVDSDLDRGRATVTVSDQGSAFDATQANSRPRARALDDAEPGGLGLMMIRSFSDDLNYLYVDGRNQLSFAVNWERVDA